MNFDFNNKVVLITGGSKGIGFAAAKIFSDMGAKVAICARNQERLNTALEELRGNSSDVYGRPVDVSNEKDFSEFAAEVEEVFGGIDVWINNAGVYPEGKLHETDLVKWNQTFSNNVNSVLIGSKLAKLYLEKRNGGVIINAASFASNMPSVNRGAYAATKASIYSMTNTLAAELAPFNIRVVGYIPGLIDTELTRDVIDQSGEEAKNQIALHRFGKPDEVAYPIVFLASDYASYITGTCLEISGGKYCVQNPGVAWTK